MKAKKYKIGRFEDQRGLLFYPDCPEVMGKVNHFVLSFTPPGQMRGNHFHKTRLEWISVLRGKAELHLMDLETKETEKMILDGQKPELIEIKPNVVLALRNISDEDMLFLGLFDRALKEGEKDDGHYELIK